MADQIDFIVTDLEDYTRSEIIALGLNVNANLRDNPPVGTPIDTGWASASWVPSVGEPKILPAEPANPSEGATPAEVAARAEIAAQGENEVLSWRLQDGPIFSTNNTTYIGPLNNGHSTQSPRGFVQNALEKAIRETYSRAASQRGRARRGAAARAAKPRPKR